MSLGGAKMNRKIRKKWVTLGFVEKSETRSMILFPHAKINIGLYVTNKRSDGYHDIITLFYPIGLSDILEVLPDSSVPHGSVDIQLTGIGVVGEPATNLVAKAYRLISRKHDIPSVRVFLHKQIPTGAGLGGGSSDGACMLRALNELFNLQIKDSAMQLMALELGSDCPFFLNPIPSIARGRGEILEPSAVSLSGYHFYLFQPAGGISTAKAYQNVLVEPDPDNFGERCRRPVEMWKGELWNGFEPYAITQIPAIGLIVEELYKKGAIYCSLTGSGSAVYGLFRGEAGISAEIDPYFIWKEILP